MNASGNAARAGCAMLMALAGPLFLAAGLALTGCSEVSNNPHPLGSEKTNTIYAPILSRSPKYLDPASSYSNDETPFTYQVYEPLYGYHYLKRPYELIGRSRRGSRACRSTSTRRARSCPSDAPGEDDRRERLRHQASSRASCSRRTRRSPRMRRGDYAYHNMKREDVADKYKLADFKQTGTRELTADDTSTGSAPGDAADQVAVFSACPTTSSA